MGINAHITASDEEKVEVPAVVPSSPLSKSRVPIRVIPLGGIASGFVSRLMLPLLVGDMTICARVFATGHLTVDTDLLPAGFCAADLLGAAVYATGAIVCLPTGVEPQIVAYGSQGQSFFHQPLNELQLSEVVLGVEALPASPLRWPDYAGSFPRPDCLRMYVQ